MARIPTPSTKKPSGNKPEPSPVAKLLYATVKENADPRPRTHLGASQVGHYCERKLWYDFRWCSETDHDGRLLRLFATGHYTEDRIIDELMDAGLTVTETQQSFSEANLGHHFAGSIDGVIVGVPGSPKTRHLLEVKTANEKSYRDLERHAVKKSKPQHYAQMMTYMRWAKLKRALYVCVNKNTDEVYTERLYYDEAHANAMIARARKIVKAAIHNEVDRVSEKRTWYQCTWCDDFEICHGSRVPPIACRNCVHATPELESKTGEATWTCESFAKKLPEYPEPCPRHCYLPGLVPPAETAGSVIPRAGATRKEGQTIALGDRAGVEQRNIANGDPAFTYEMPAVSSEDLRRKLNDDEMTMAEVIAEAWEDFGPPPSDPEGEGEGGQAGPAEDPGEEAAPQDAQEGAGETQPANGSNHSKDREPAQDGSQGAQDTTEGSASAGRGGKEKGSGRITTWKV